MMQLEFDGDTYEREWDYPRLATQLSRVRSLMRDGRWRTLEEIWLIAGGSMPAISARLRDLRKPKYGSYTVERRARGDREKGLFEYRMVV